MATKDLLMLVLSLLCLVHVGNSWLTTDFVPVTDEALLAKGYSCKSNDAALGLMKQGEHKTLAGKCVEATCSKGYISYTGCVPSIEIHGCVIVEEPAKPYPHCCPTPKCEEH